MTNTLNEFIEKKILEFVYAQHDDEAERNQLRTALRECAEETNNALLTGYIEETANHRTLNERSSTWFGTNDHPKNQTEHRTPKDILDDQGFDVHDKE